MRYHVDLAALDPMPWRFDDGDGSAGRCCVGFHGFHGDTGDLEPRTLRMEVFRGLQFFDVAKSEFACASG